MIRNFRVHAYGSCELPWSAESRYEIGMSDYHTSTI